jgi:hypothetical protein
MMTILLRTKQSRQEVAAVHLAPAREQGGHFGSFELVPHAGDDGVDVTASEHGDVVLTAGHTWICGQDDLGLSRVDVEYCLDPILGAMPSATNGGTSSPEHQTDYSDSPFICHRSAPLTSTVGTVTNPGNLNRHSARLRSACDIRGRPPTNSTGQA